jgi:hypothetical protein
MKKSVYLFLMLLASYYPVEAQVNLSSGLVAEYQLDSTSLVNSVGNMHFQSAAAHIAVPNRFGIPNRAIQLVDTAMPVITFPDVQQIPNGNAARSISIWCKLNSIPASGISNSYFLYYHGGSNVIGSGFGLALGSNSIHIIGFLNDLDVNFPLVVDKWMHIVASYNGTTAKLYVDGNLLSQGIANWSTIGFEARLGHFDVNSSTTGPRHYNRFDGHLDDFRIYNRVINTQEVLALYNRQIVGIDAIENTNQVWEIYPNPTSENVVFLMNTPSSSTKNKSVQLYNLNGILMQEIYLDEVIQNGIDISSLPKGVYLVKIEGESRIKKLIKQ